jgi:hypothetical protein
MAGAVGAMLFSGLLHLLFENPWGWVLFIVALIGAIIFAAGALALNVPIYIVIVTSAFAGASLAVTGALTLVGHIQVSELANGGLLSVTQEIKDRGLSWLWLLLWLVLAILGVVYQLRSVTEAQLPEEKWVPARVV